MLQALDDKKQRKHYLVLFCWLLSVLVSAQYFIAQQSVAFDPADRLMDLNSESLLQQIIAEHNVSIQSFQIVEFVSADCHCNRVTELHKRKLENFANQNGVGFSSIEIDSSNSVTSTPSVLVTNNQGELVYFGPVGEGIGCNENTDVVQTAITNYQLGFNPSLVNAQAEGCYCNL